MAARGYEFYLRVLKSYHTHPPKKYHMQSSLKNKKFGFSQQGHRAPQTQKQHPKGRCTVNLSIEALLRQLKIAVCRIDSAMKRRGSLNQQPLRFVVDTLKLDVR
ncbi:unnamed protein product [Porites lobata]|uniref:Uncharacterized protein n=1 Tax=Porites lobata TaxID=104759 RepID=A0ABN8QPE8_9CNID|nr:unnamed protein product [Porites lobata]